MTDTQLEIFLQKAVKVSFNPGSASLFHDSFSGTMSMLFDHDMEDDCIEAYKFIRSNLSGHKIHLRVKRGPAESVSITLIFDTPNATVLNINDLRSDKDALAWFYKKHPKDMSIIWFLKIHNKLGTLGDLIASEAAQHEVSLAEGIEISSCELCND